MTDSYINALEILRHTALDSNVPDKDFKAFLSAGVMMELKNKREKADGLEALLLGVLTTFISSKAVDWTIYRYELAHFLETFLEGQNAMAI